MRYALQMNQYIYNYLMLLYLHVILSGLIHVQCICTFVEAHWSLISRLDGMAIFVSSHLSSLGGSFFSNIYVLQWKVCNLPKCYCPDSTRECGRRESPKGHTKTVHHSWTSPPLIILEFSSCFISITHFFREEWMVEIIQFSPYSSLEK